MYDENGMIKGCYLCKKLVINEMQTFSGHNWADFNENMLSIWKKKIIYILWECLVILSNTKKIIYFTCIKSTVCLYKSVKKNLPNYFIYLN